MELDEEAANMQNEATKAMAPLLQKYEQGLYDFQENVPERKSIGQKLRRAFIIVAFLAFSYALGFLSANRVSRPSGMYAGASYSPASAAIKFREMSFDGNLDAASSFRGKPRPELDEAWHNLLEHQNLRLSKDELSHLHHDTIALHDGTGYYGQMGVYHHLHCLKLIRQLLHPDYYDADFPDRDIHIDHCIDGLRQTLMCHPDISILTSRWKPNYRRPWPNFKVDQTCVDWESLDAWSAQRSFSVFDQKSLVHPDMGIVFPMINGTIEQTAHGPDIHIVWPEE